MAAITILCGNWCAMTVNATRMPLDSLSNIRRTNIVEVVRSVMIEIDSIGTNSEYLIADSRGFECSSAISFGTAE